ncbi:hypothetical protein TWF696_005614 [Orbilia brochopaga]|uniref:Uncharacterized protein n=1 Tax=Orbilia brochopaga TaxID=3140254 RepID=A0AAV9V4J8_9PEZI
MTTPSSPLSMDAKTKFQQLWAQFGTAFMEEPMRDHEKRVEELVRENERLRLELSTAKTEHAKAIEDQQHKYDELQAEYESLRQEVTNEVRSGIERVQERNQTLALVKKENASLRLVFDEQETIWAQDKARYKQTIKLLRDELQSAVTAHERLRKNIGVLRGEIVDSDTNEETDSEAELDGERDDVENEVELQLQTERSLQSSAYRRASRRQQVEETPGLDGPGNAEDDGDSTEELEYFAALEPEDDAENQEADEANTSTVSKGNGKAKHQLETEDAPGPSRRQLRTTKPRDSETRTSENTETEKSIQTEQTEPALRRSTRIRNSDVGVGDNVPTVNGHDTIEVVGTKRGRDHSSDLATTDGSSQTHNHHNEYELAAPTSMEPDDPNERPSKRTRRQTERYINALETTRNMAKIMTPPATSPTFLPSVLPRRSANRSPNRRSTSLAQTTTITPKPRRSSILRSPVTAPPPSTKQDNTPAKSPVKSPKSPKANKKQDHPNHMFDFVLVSGYKHGRNLIIDDSLDRDMMEPLLQATTERIRDVAVTPGFWRSYAHKRNIQRRDAGLTPHCAYTSQFPMDSEEVETNDPWSNGLEHACDNCMKEGIACFTVGERKDTEKYKATYRPPPKGKA